jgi:hypothetical protein
VITDSLEKFAFVKESRVGKVRVGMCEVLECRKNRSVYGSWIFRTYGEKELSVHIISCVEPHVIIPRQENVDDSTELGQREIIAMDHDDHRLSHTVVDTEVFLVSSRFGQGPKGVYPTLTKRHKRRWGTERRPRP